MALATDDLLGVGIYPGYIPSSLSGRTGTRNSYLGSDRPAGTTEASVTTR